MPASPTPIRCDALDPRAPGCAARARGGRCGRGAVRRRGRRRRRAVVRVERRRSRRTIAAVADRTTRGERDAADRRPTSRARRSSCTCSARCARRARTCSRRAPGWSTRSRRRADSPQRPIRLRVNLARPVVDGEQLAVLAVGRGAAAAGFRGRRDGPAADGTVQPQHRRPRGARHPAPHRPGAGPAHHRLARRERPVHERRRAARASPGIGDEMFSRPRATSGRV